MIDFDDTVGAFNQHICDTLERVYGDVIEIDDLQDWAYWSDHPREDFIWGERCFHSREWTLQIPIIRGVRQALNAIERRGDTYMFVSDRWDHMEDWLAEWMRFYGITAPVVVTGKRRSKIDIAREYDLTIAVDDSPHWCDAFEFSDQIERAYVMSYPYNRDVDTTGKLTRVNSWNQLRQVEGMA